MIQELISYAIIGGALAVVATRLFRSLKKTPGEKISGKPKCSSCSAECVLRDSLLKKQDKCLTNKELNY